MEGKLLFSKKQLGRFPESGEIDELLSREEGIH